jgi:hypothetical protein
VLNRVLSCSSRLGRFTIIAVSIFCFILYSFIALRTMLYYVALSGLFFANKKLQKQNTYVIASTK